MSGPSTDPATQASTIWAKALRVLRSDPSLTARSKGWLEQVRPEAMFGTTIILDVESSETQHELQIKLNDPLLSALELANGGMPLFPYFKIVPRQAPEEPPTLPIDDLPAVDSATVEIIDYSAGQSTAKAATPSNFAGAQQPSADHGAARGGKRAATRASSPATGQLPAVRPTPQPAGVTHYDDAVVQSFEDIMPGTNFDSVPTPPAMPQNGTAGYSGVPRFGTGKTPDRDPVTHLNRNDTFDTFVPGESNRFARTVALAVADVAEGIGIDFNPLCIYGRSGLGKTHLLNAIGNYALVKKPDTRVRYVTSEEFTNEFIDSLRPDKSGSNQQSINNFNKRYREVDILLIDDIQFLGGKPETLTQFFHTFNTLQQAGKRIVIASDVPPKNLKDFEDRLISRFEQGLTVDIQPPDLETRIAILRMLASRNGTRVPNDVLDLIAQRFTENIRELEGALNRVTAMASLNGQPVTRALAEQTLQDFFSTAVEVKPTDIIGHVAKYFHLTFDDIVGPSRQKNITLARQIAMFLMRDLTSMSLVNIGQVMGGRDHTTVMHGCKNISEGMQERQDIYNYVNELTLQLKQRND